MLNDSNHTEASFFAYSDESVGLQVAQIPRFPEVGNPITTTDIYYMKAL